MCLSSLVESTLNQFPRSDSLPPSSTITSPFLVALFTSFFSLPDVFVPQLSPINLVYRSQRLLLPSTHSLFAPSLHPLFLAPTFCSHPLILTFLASVLRHLLIPRLSPLRLIILSCHPSSTRPSQIHFPLRRWTVGNMEMSAWPGWRSEWEDYVNMAGLSLRH